MWWGVAMGGQVFDDVVPLERAVRAADAVVVAKISGEPVDYRIPVPDTSGRPCEPVGSRAWPVVVERVLGQAELGPALDRDARLDVHGGSMPIRLHLATATCVDGTSESPIVPRYVGATPEPGKSLVLLLRWSPPVGWIEAVDGAWLAADQAEHVVRDWTVTSHRGGAALDAFELVACRADADCVAACSACGPCPKEAWEVTHVAAAASFARTCSSTPDPAPATAAPMPACRAGRCVSR